MPCGGSIHRLEGDRSPMGLSRRQSLRIPASSAVLLLCLGCRTVPEPPPPILVPAERKVVTRHFAGSPLGGFLEARQSTAPPKPAADAAPQAAWAAPLRVKIDLVAVDKLQAEGMEALDPLAAHSRLI